MFKINFDGAVFKTKNKSGVGVVIRDHRGLVIASLAQQFPQAFQVLEIEAIAAGRALKFGIEVGLNEAVLNGDCQLIMKAPEEGGNTIASVKPLIMDSLGLTSSFNKLLYSHSKRNGNKLAHNLAKHFIDVSNYAVWMEDVPPSFFFHCLG